jgi:putative RNA 2'-phosphotransferase
MDEKTLVRRSKYLSLILRHNPGKIGIVLDSAGWTLVKDLLHAVGWTFFDLSYVVANNDKKRFEFSEDQKKIRASQGHSVNVDLEYEVKVPPENLYHGTSRDSYGGILKNGLLKMERHDVHLFADHDKALDIARKRRPRPMVLTINALKMVEDGYTFRLSTNQVWLIETVPPKYIFDLG